MDKRYKETRSSTGDPVSTRREQQREDLVKSHLARARHKAHHDQKYGGSTGGLKSISGAGDIASRRGEERRAQKAIFEREGSGELSGRDELSREWYESRRFPDLGR